MALLEAILLGFIQGITEWLPISSEGITSLVMVQFFGKSLQDAVYYSLWLHLGTLLAALVYFKQDVKEILKGLPNYVKNPQENKLTTFLLLGTACTAIIGIPLLFYGLATASFSGGMAIALIGFLLIVTGILQLVAKKTKQLQKEPTGKIGVLTGSIQGFAVLPGLSRSGLTTAVLLFSKYDAKQALRLSFLLSIPVVLVAQIGLGLLGKVSFDISSLVAVGVAFVAGLVTLKVLLKLAEELNFGWFCITLGLVSVLQLAI